ncbi:MATE family efflux transporter [Marinisporobacter balticus]|uniref:Multidrug export protein MepA n=1 Tax=Marinisporobacter balticus TaxID=2018667 RepID=A0A4R2KRI8_9FIRM|nr:MATE family efflux transporter [Marinisporobacter balticus]TCO69235.1 putative MATE family efflux protein [Marinisporobacter balticus]
MNKKQGQNKRLILMREENVTKALFKLGIPMVVSMLVVALYNVVDTYFVSSLGTQQVGAVSVAFPLSLYFSGIGLTFGVGGASYISRLLGAKENKKVNEVAATSLYTSLIIGMILVIMVLVFLTPILKFMGATDTILPYAKCYAVIFTISMLFSTANVTAGNLAISQGASNITLRAMISGSVLNMILDPLLIYTLNMGVKGAAIATLISQIITSLIYIWFFFGENSYIHIGISNFKLKLDIYSQVIKIGISMMLLQFLTGFSMSLISRTASYYGDEAVAAMGIVLRIVTLGTNVVFGFMKGFQPMAGFNYGAKNYTRLREVTRISVKLTTIYCVLWTLVVVLFANQIVSLLSNDTNVIAIAEKALKANTIMFFTFGFQFAYSTLYLSIGRALWGGVLNIGRQGLFLIPVILLLPKFFQLNGVIYAQPVADIITTIITIVLAIKIEKELINLRQEKFQN